MNSKLINTNYPVPDNILKYINAMIYNYPDNKGTKRAKFILNNGKSGLSYQELEGLKHTLKYSDDKIAFNLFGGALMQAFVDNTLNSARDGAKRSAKINKTIQPNVMADYGVGSTRIEEDVSDKPIENSIAIIVNDNMKILLLKRGVVENGWGNGQWGLVGGGIEEGESPEVACVREVMEETGINITEYSKKMIIQRNPETIEHFFIVKHIGSDNVQLNDEHTDYGWFSMVEVKMLDTVPQLNEYLTLIFKKYE